MAHPKPEDVLMRPRRIFKQQIEAAKARGLSHGLRRLLDGMDAAMAHRSPTSNEKALVRVIQEADASTIESKCLRCGGSANDIASVLSGFACCDTCWQAVRFIIERSKARLLEVDLVTVDLTQVDISADQLSNMSDVEFL